MFYVNGINNAFEQLCRKFANGFEGMLREETRNGMVYSFEDPVTICYSDIMNDRVLIHPGRDCNPFFHYFEGLWMLAGCNDVESLKWFNSKISDFSDDGVLFNGAYGHRWRNYYDYNLVELTGLVYPESAGDTVGMYYHFDQIEFLVKHLQETPNSRRAVLQMWNVSDDLVKIDNTFGKYSKDVCCNTAIYFRITEVHGVKQLNMTVTNRSNDLVWGTLGANFSHMSFLLEYMAGRLGLKVGYYYQFTNNLHIYDFNSKFEFWADYYKAVDTGCELQDADLYERVVNKPNLPGVANLFFGVNHNDKDQIRLLHNNITAMVKGVSNFKVWNDMLLNQDKMELLPHFKNVAVPLIQAFYIYKVEKDFDHALTLCEQIKDDGLQLACGLWLRERQRRHEAKQQGE